MKKLLSVILSVIMIMTALPFAVSAEEYFPALTEKPKVIYAWEDTSEYGTALLCEIQNSAEIVKLCQNIEAAGGIREYYDGMGLHDASLDIHIQIAYSLNGGASWVNDFGTEVMGTDYYPYTESEDAPNGLGRYVDAPIPGLNGRSNAAFQTEQIFNLRYYCPNYYSEEEASGIADYISQGKAFFCGSEYSEEYGDYGFAVDFNRNTALIKARYVVCFSAEGIEARRECGGWSEVFTFNKDVTPQSAGFDIPDGKKFNAPGFELLTVFEDDGGGQDFLFGITPDPALARMNAEFDAVVNADWDSLPKIYGTNDGYCYVYKAEIRLNGGGWRYFDYYDTQTVSFDWPDYNLKSRIEDIFGVTPGASDDIELRICLLPSDGCEWDEESGRYLPTDPFAWSDYSAPVRIPMSGLYYIDYRENGGGFPYGTERIYEFGKSLNTVIDLTSYDYTPERYGYEFDGWYSDEELTEEVTSIDTSVKRDYSVYAKWLGDEYDITYDLGGISAYNPNKEMYTPLMDDIELEDVYSEGVTFLGWSYTPGGEYVTKIDVSQAKDLTLYANWDFPAHAVTYVLNGGVNASGNPASVRADETGECKTGLYAPARKGFIFDGWYYDAEFTDGLYEEDGKWTLSAYGDVSVYAKWIKGRWDINYIIPEANAGTYHGNPDEYTYGDTVTLKAPDPAGYTFDGWFTDAAYTKAAPVPAVTETDEGEKTFYGKFTEKSYTVSYNIYVEDADKCFRNTNPTSRLYTQNIMLAELTPVSPVYKFLGWYDNVNFNGAPVTEIASCTDKNTVLYAKVFRYQWGDIDFNGKVDSADARLALRQSVGLEHLEKDQIAWGNLDAPGDGTLSSADARLILRISVGLESVEKLGLPDIPAELIG